MCTCVTVINSRKSTAKKNYPDDGWDIIQEWIADGCWFDKKREKPMTFSEKRLLVGLKNNNPSFIKRGQTYQYQFNSMDGTTYTWRTKSFFFELMCRYKLFPEC